MKDRISRLFAKVRHETRWRGFNAKLGVAEIVVDGRPMVIDLDYDQAWAALRDLGEYLRERSRERRP